MHEIASLRSQGRNRYPGSMPFCLID
jgi:hypothetical protein